MKTETFPGLNQLLFGNHSAVVNVNNQHWLSIPKGLKVQRKGGQSPCCPPREGGGERHKKNVCPGELGSYNGESVRKGIEGLLSGNGGLPQAKKSQDEKGASRHTGEEQSRQRRRLSQWHQCIDSSGNHELLLNPFPPIPPPPSCQ